MTSAFDEPLPMADGRYVIEHFDIYVSHPGMATMLICDDDEVIGFVIVSVPPHFMDAYCVQHLFVLNGHRRRGAATEAMRAVFRSMPGEYRVGQPFEHAESIAFWKRLDKTELIEYAETVEGEGLEKELVQRFAVGP